MAGIKEIKFKKIKKNRVWITVFFFILFALVAHILLAATAVSFLYNLSDTKIASTYDQVVYMRDLYDQNKGDDGVYALLDKSGSSYIIRSKTGSLIHVSGENTCGNEEGFLDMLGSAEKVYLYRDTKQGYFYPDGRGRLTVDIMGLRDWFKTEGENVIKGFGVGTDKVSFPIWIKAPSKDGSYDLIVKKSLDINLKDLIILASFAAAIGILIFFAVIVMVVNVVGSFTNRKRMTALFFMDEVTGGHNWMWFTFKGEQFLKKKRNLRNPYAIIDLVFVNYRNFCVCHSVAEGEETLRRVDGLINSAIGKKEMCAHYASANFALMLEFNGKENLEQRLWALIKLLEGIDSTHRFSFHLGVDIVPASIDPSGKTVPRRLMDVEKEYNNACAARATLSDSDDSGIAFFDDKLVEEQKWLDIVQEGQQRALDNEEFQVYYQPKYDPRDNRLKGAEALIRWISPQYGFIGPGKFIPIFEKNGFITKIDHYMIKHVAADQKRWLDQGLTCVPVSVNVSRAHFIEKDLAEQIRDMVDEAGTPHEYIEIELTESAFFDDKRSLVTTILKLKEYGFEVSMDDFGAGYSSLNSLKDMPLDVLKLDAEFFRGDVEGDRDKIVVSEAIKLAKKLNMRTVAEGIEVKEQVDFLAEQGCDLIQGFYFAKPMPKDDFEQRMISGISDVSDETL